MPLKYSCRLLRAEEFPFWTQMSADYNDIKYLYVSVGICVLMNVDSLLIYPLSFSVFIVLIINLSPGGQAFRLASANISCKAEALPYNPAWADRYLRAYPRFSD